MFIFAAVLFALAVYAAWFSHKQRVQARSETARIVSLLFAALATLFAIGGVLKWGTA